MEMTREAAVQALAVTIQEWKELGQGNDATMMAPTEVETCVSRIASLLMVRTVAIIAAPERYYENLSTSCICRKALIESVPWWPDRITPNIWKQWQQYVRAILLQYNQDLPFHNYQHAYHVTISANKLLDLMLALDSNSYMDNHPPPTFGLRYDPISQLALLFAALIHDVDHRGVTNRQLIAEDDPLALIYNDESVTEQRSLTVAFAEFLKPDYADLRAVLFPDEHVYRFFRMTVVNAVLSTDLAGPERAQLVKSKWREAFENYSNSSHNHNQNPHRGGNANGPAVVIGYNDMFTSPSPGRRGSLGSDYFMSPGLRNGMTGGGGLRSGRRGSNASINSAVSDLSADSYVMMQKQRQVDHHNQRRQQQQQSYLRMSGSPSMRSNDSLGGNSPPLSDYDSMALYHPQQQHTPPQQQQPRPPRQQQQQQQARNDSMTGSSIFTFHRRRTYSDSSPDPSEYAEDSVALYGGGGAGGGGGTPSRRHLHRRGSTGSNLGPPRMTTNEYSNNNNNNNNNYGSGGGGGGGGMVRRRSSLEYYSSNNINTAAGGGGGGGARRTSLSNYSVDSYYGNASAADSLVFQHQRFRQNHHLQQHQAGNFSPSANGGASPSSQASPPSTPMMMLPPGLRREQHQRRNSTATQNTRATEYTLESVAADSVALQQRRLGGHAPSRRRARAMAAANNNNATLQTTNSVESPDSDLDGDLDAALPPTHLEADMLDDESSLSLTPPSEDDDFMDGVPITGVTLSRSFDTAAHRFQLPPRSGGGGGGGGGNTTRNGNHNMRRSSIEFPERTTKANPRMMSRRASTGNSPQMRFRSLTEQRIDEESTLSFRRRSADTSELGGSSHHRTTDSQKKYRKRLGIRRSMDLSGEQIEVYPRHSLGGSSFSEPLSDAYRDEPDFLRSSVVLELLLRTADVAHALQGWDNMVKWTSRMYMELAAAHRAGRGHDPGPGWFDNQIKIMESYLAPLSERLDQTGVYGEFLGAMFNHYVVTNKDHWLVKGFDITAELQKEAERKYPKEATEGDLYFL